jgi:CheY-like chemotaxis protein
MHIQLRLLVIDGHPESVQSLVEFLVSRGHRAELLTNGHEALSTIVQRRRNDDPFDLIIANVSLPALDGVSLLRELRARQDKVECALYSEMFIAPETVSSAQRLGCSLLMEGIDVRKIDELLTRCLRERKLSGAKDKDQPFFGTSRVTRTVSKDHVPGGDSSGSKPAVAPNSDPLPMPAPAPTPAPAPAASTPGDLSGSYQPSVQVGPVQYPRRSSEIGTSTRIRRGVTGRIEADPGISAAATGSERRVVCAMCHREFIVSSSLREFTVVCVHCGQLNRIAPR